MKQLALAVMAVAVFGAASLEAATKPAKHPALSSDTVVWAGLDYSKVRMIGPGEFSNAESIFPGMLDAWNNLFLQERLQFVERETKKRVLPDVGGMTEVNKRATEKQIFNTMRPEDTIDKTHLTQQDIVDAVKSYKLENKTGLGVVFIVDRLVKIGKKGQGAVYVVAFDVASREVLFSERVTHNAVGFGFRNYWFRVIKDSEKALGKIR